MWQIVMKKENEQKMTTLTKNVVAACVLYNICIDRGDLYYDDCDHDDDSDMMMETDLYLKPAMM